MKVKVKAFFKITSSSGNSPFDLIEEVFSFVGTMTKYLISAVEATVLFVVEDMVFLFQTKPAYPSDRVKSLPFVNNFPLYAVIYWWS